MKTKRCVLPYARQSIDARDIAAVADVLRSELITQGPLVAEFEQAIASYCGARYAVAFSSGTAALHAAVFAADIGEKDEVITTPMTFVASSNCILYCGGTPVFVDTSVNSPLIDSDQIEQKITKQTKAILPVDYAGIPADYEMITKIARKHKLLVIADAAHSLGATFQGKRIGTLADMTIFSFHPVKLITSAEGGMVTTNSRDFARKLRVFRTHGITKKEQSLRKKGQGDWYYEMQHLGYNYRLSDIHAALGLSQFRKISQFLQKRQKIADFYHQAFRQSDLLDTLTVPNDRISAWHLFPVLLQLERLTASRKKIFAELGKRGIRAQVHYIPVHVQPVYQKRLGYKEGDFPVVKDFYDREISIPLFPAMSKADCWRVVDILVAVLEKYRR